MTEEHKQKIKEGRERAKALKAANTPAQESPLDALNKKLDSLSDIVMSLSERVIGGQIKEAEKTATHTPPPSPPHEVAINDMIPSSWRNMVNKYLGEDFKTDVTDSNGNFILRLWVPDEFDRRVGDRVGKDHSAGLVRRSSDLADVEYWCKLVRANLATKFDKFKSIV